jgi:serine/threonine protein kinase/tetratricopeptide (TPR) repeat protein
MIGKTISHYKILEKLGEGGMGVVYKAEDTKLRRTVALKFLAPELGRDPEARKRFLHEAQAASALDHPSICTVYEVDEHEGNAFIAMACLEGQSLKDRIASGPMKLEEATDIAIQIAEGLQEAHERGVIHRDIKPANVILTPKAQAKIMDFGLAKAPGRTKLTKTGMTLGTAAYMSPEQARGGEIDHRTDIWSLGVVLYEMISGRLPFGAEYEQALLYSILNEKPEPLTGLRTGVPMELEQLVDKCMEKDPAERYQTGGDLLADFSRLKRTMAELKVRSRSEARPSKGLQPSRRWPWIAAVAVVAAVAAIVLRAHLFPSKEGPAEHSTSVRKMLVVLPFRNLGSPEHEYFADGLTEEITSRLAAIHDLGVISGTSAFHYKGTDKTIKQIGEELGVDYVLEGTVRWEQPGSRESRVRISPQLIRVSDDIHLWSERYDRRFEEVFDVQSDVAQKVIQQLGITLVEKERLALDVIPTDNPEAYQAYLRGLELLRKRGDPLLREQMFERAVQLDPDFALAQARLSFIHSWIYHIGTDRTPERLDAAKSAADRAIELQPALPEAHKALGWYYYLGFRDYENALREFSIAAKDEPNDHSILHGLASIKKRKGDFEGGLELYTKASEIDPVNVHSPFEIAWSYLYLRRYREADAFWDRCISLAPDDASYYVLKARNHRLWRGDTAKAREVLEQVPRFEGDSQNRMMSGNWYVQELCERDYQAALRRLAPVPENTFYNNWGGRSPKVQMEGMVYWLMGDMGLARISFDSARAVLEAEIQRLPDDYRVHSSLGVTYAGLGRKDDAIMEGKLAVELWPVSKDAFAGPELVENLALIYVMVGEHDDALQEIESILSIPAEFSVELLRIEPIWDPLRDHPRYKELLAKYSDPDA